MASKKRGRKKARGRRKTARASTALRAGSIVTRKLSPATLKKQGLKLKAVGKMAGKTAYKVVRTSKPRAQSRSSIKPRAARVSVSQATIDEWNAQEIRELNALLEGK